MGGAKASAEGETLDHVEASELTPMYSNHEVQLCYSMQISV